MKKKYIKPELHSLYVKGECLMSVSINIGEDMDEGTTYARKHNTSDLEEEDLEEELPWGTVWGNSSWGNVWDE